MAYPEWITTESERRLHDDFRAFVWLLWRALKLPAPTRRQLAIAMYLQHGPKRRMVQAWRGAAKTWLTCAYALWRLYRNQNERVKIVSANEKKAVENATFIRQLLDIIPQLAALRPRIGTRDSVLAFDVAGADPAPTPSVSCVGITGQLTGGRATILISDDVEVPKNSYTETMREHLAELVKEYDALVVPEGFDIIFLGTPQTEQSIYNRVRTRGYDCRIWPVRYPHDIDLARYGGALAPDIIADMAAGAVRGSSVEPSRFSDIDLAEREASYGRSGFALQFMLDTSLSDADRYPLKLAELIVHDLDSTVGHVRMTWASGPAQVITDLSNIGFTGDRWHRPMYIAPEVAPWEGTIMFIDPSGRGRDETAYAVVSQLKGMLYLRASGGLRDGYSDETLTELARVAKRFNVGLIRAEPNFGDGMFVKLFEPVLLTIHKCTLEESERATGQKERRIIDGLEPVLNQHRLVVDRAVVKADLKQAEEDPQYSLFYQLTHLTKDRGSLRHDDRIEALEGACRYFSEQLAQDTEKSAKAHRDKLFEAEVQKILRLAGKTSIKGRYITRHGRSRPARNTA